MANVAEAQIIGNDTDAGGTAFGRVMDASNLFFTAVFTVELAINLFAHWLKPFLCNPWSLLDAFVAALIPPVEIPITVLRGPSECIVRQRRARPRHGLEAGPREGGGVENLASRHSRRVRSASLPLTLRGGDS